MIPIVIPLHHGGGKLKNNTELRFALRSIERHFKDPYEIVIVGKDTPYWLEGVRHIYAGGLKSSLRAAAKAYPGGFFWYYDDVVILADITAKEMKVTNVCPGWQTPTTGWAKSLDGVRERLQREGYVAFDYSRPHGPYWFDLSMVNEGFADWPGMKSKFPWESWILSKRNWPRIRSTVRQYYGKFKSEPSSKHRFLNYNDVGTTPELIAYLRARFPDCSRFENSDDMSKEQTYLFQSRHLFDAWRSIGSPELRSVCECAVGPFSLLPPFREHARRHIYIEPSASFAANARVVYPWAEVHQVAIAENFGKANLRNVGGSSYVKGIPWAPIFTDNPQKARKAGKQPVRTVPFHSLDDGSIDVLNLDCEGSEWFVLKTMVSRPLLIQIEHREENPFVSKIAEWFAENGYVEIGRWHHGADNIIYHKAQ